MSMAEEVEIIGDQWEVLAEEGITDCCTENSRKCSMNVWTWED